MPKRGISYISRRAVQSFTHFTNGPSLLRGMARGGEMTFHTRTGLTLHTPNVPGARFPVYEVNADDVYRLDEVLEGLDHPTVVDIGAHIGSFTAAVATKRPGANVHAYEASPSTAVWLERNVAANDLGQRVSVHRCAVADHSGTLEIVDNGEASAHNGLTAPEDSGSIVSVPCVTWADVVDRAGGSVDVVKLDAEGVEYGIILDSDPATWSTVQRIVMEYHPVSGRSLGQLVDHLEPLGLSLARDEPADRPGLGNAWFVRR